MTKEEKDNLIKYLENMIEEENGGNDLCSSCISKVRKKVYQDILERVKNNNYE